MSKRQEMRERRQKEKQQRRLTTLGSIIISAGLIVAALIYGAPKPNVIQAFSRYMAQDNAMGDPNAPIKIIEFSNYKCGHCAAFTFETEPLLAEEYIQTGKVYFISKTLWDDIPSEAAYCAGEQNKYWEMRDVLFANQAMPFDDNATRTLAKSIDVDMDKFNECMDERTYADRVIQDNDDSQKAGLEATPSFLISYVVDGELVEEMLVGNVPYTQFQWYIERALSEVGQ